MPTKPLPDGVLLEAVKAWSDFHKAPPKGRLKFAADSLDMDSETFRNRVQRAYERAHLHEEIIARGWPDPWPYWASMPK